MTKRVIGCVVVMAAVAGCAVDLDVDSAGLDVADSEEKSAVIINTIDWQEAATLAEGTAERANSKAVAYISIPARGTRCTGFMISPDVLMTNEHCISQAADARGVTANFRYELNATSSQTFDCSTFVGNDAALDYALLQCTGRPGDVVGVVDIDARPARRDEAVYAIHQNCDYYTDRSCAPTKKLSPGLVRQTGGAEFGHDADTLGGSSGSPVFAKSSHKVIGLHHVGRGGNNMGRGTMNMAVSMANIVPVLRQRYPGLQLGARAPADTPSTPAPTTDSYEPNDTRAGAASITLPFASTTARIDANDLDVYGFTSDGGARTITLTFTHAQGDLDLVVEDATGAAVARSAGVSNVERIAKALPAGPLFVRVLGYRGAQGAYTLTVQ